MTKAQMIKVLKKTGKEFDNCYHQDELIKLLNIEKCSTQFNINFLSDDVICNMRGYQFNTNELSVVTTLDLNYCNGNYQARNNFVEWYMKEHNLGEEWL